MSKLTQTRALDELLIDLLEVTNPNSVEGDYKLFFEQQTRKNSCIYYAPIFDGKTQEIHSHYATGKIRVRINSKTEYYPIYKKPDLECKVLGNNSQDSNDREKIAYFLSHLTLNNNISKQIDTKYRLELWLQHKDYLYRLASCFLEDKHLLERECEQGVLNRHHKDLIFKDFQIYNSLFQIIDKKWEKIAIRFSHNKKFTFDSSLDLFLEIIGTIFDREYTKFLLPQRQFRQKKNQIFFELMKKIDRYQIKDNLCTKEEQKFEKLIKKFNKDITPCEIQNYWFKRIKTFFQEEANKKVGKDLEVEEYTKYSNHLVRDRFEITQNRKFPRTPDSSLIEGIIHKGLIWKSASGKINPSRKSNKSKQNA